MRSHLLLTTEMKFHRIDLLRRQFSSPNNFPSKRIVLQKKFPKHCEETVLSEFTEERSLTQIWYSWNTFYTIYSCRFYNHVIILILAAEIHSFPFKFTDPSRRERANKFLSFGQDDPKHEGFFEVHHQAVADGSVCWRQTQTRLWCHRLRSQVRLGQVWSFIILEFSCSV